MIDDSTSALQHKVDQLREAYNAAAVPLQLVVDPNNPAWAALREQARTRAAAVTRETYLVLELDTETGRMCPVGDASATKEIMTPSGALTVTPPMKFASEALARGFLKVFGFHVNKYLIVRAVADMDGTDLVKEEVRREVPSTTDLESYFQLLGFTYDESAQLWRNHWVGFRSSDFSDMTWEQIGAAIFLGGGNAGSGAGGGDAE